MDWVLFFALSPLLSALGGIFIFSAYNDYSKSKYLKKSMNGDIIQEIEKVVQNGTMVKKEKAKELKVNTKRAGIKIQTDGRAVFIRTKTDTNIFVIRKNSGGYWIEERTRNRKAENELKLFMPYLERLYDEMIMKHNQEFGKTDNHLNKLIQTFAISMENSITEHKKYEISTGTYAMKYVKSFGVYTIQLFMKDKVIWKYRINPNELDGEQEVFKSSEFTDEKAAYYQEKIIEIKTIIHQILQGDKSLVAMEIQNVYQLISEKNQDDNEVKRKMDNIFHLYQALSSEMKIQKEQEMLALIHEIKEEIQKEKVYLVE